MDEWSDDDDEPRNKVKEKEPISQNSEMRRVSREIRRLKERLAAAQQDLVDYRNLVNDNIANITTGALGNVPLDEIRKEELPSPGPRDDDTHYFDSYNEQGTSDSTLTFQIKD
jgi:protein arginine N-methyltransferase 3